MINEKVAALIEKGVRIPNPEAIEIGDDVDIDRISGNGVVLHSGCRIFGKSTLILSNVKLGYEAPVTLENCWVGPGVTLLGGYFQGSVFLENVKFGSCGHVRTGTIMEEESSAAHAVGLKQTILLPFVTLGSLINFCDCLMAGGTDRKNHSEVGSSYIHFNYTPNQDKATPSLIGDVPNGVMMNQPPVFLGGQGGLVGPCRIAFGTVAAAGSIVRKDEIRPGRLIFTGTKRSGNIPFTPGGYQGIKRIIKNNIIYTANLAALKSWYGNARRRFLSPDFPEALLQGLLLTIDTAINERIRRIEQYFENMSRFSGCPESSDLPDRNEEILSLWKKNRDMFREIIETGTDDPNMDIFLEKLEKSLERNGRYYPNVIKLLSPEDIRTGTNWLQGIVDRIVSTVLDRFSI